MRNIASLNIDLELALQIQSTVLFVAKWGKENAHAAYSDRAGRDPDHRRPHGAGHRDRQRQSCLKPQRGDAVAVEPSVAVTATWPVNGLYPDRLPRGGVVQRRARRVADPRGQ